MKVTIAYQCDLEDIPKQVGALLNILKEEEIVNISTQLCRAQRACYEKNISVALEEIDAVRVLLTKIDQKLLDYGAIAAGYLKTDTDLKLGVHPNVHQQEKETINDQVDSSDKSEPE